MCRPPSAGLGGTGVGAAVAVFPPARATAGIHRPLVTAAPPAPATPLMKAPRDIARSQKCACPAAPGGCGAPLRDRSFCKAAGCCANRAIVMEPPPHAVGNQQIVSSATNAGQGSRAASGVEGHPRVPSAERLGRSRRATESVDLQATQPNGLTLHGVDAAGVTERTR